MHIFNQPKMKKVITFSLWGENPTYTIGAIKNAKDAQTFYPDFECWFYIHIDSVPRDIVQQLQELPNVKIIFKYGDINIVKPMMWRFEAIDDESVEVMMSRDTDTRFLLREKLAVEEWLKSDKLFHIMRDHPNHTWEVQAGMFGTRKIPQIRSWCYIMDTFRKIRNPTDDAYFFDQYFLKRHVYPYIQYDSVIHASYHKYEPHSIPFPIPYDSDYQFVGEYIYSDDTFRAEHRNLLRDHHLP
jgi:hypothetical protein